MHGTVLWVDSVVRNDSMARTKKKLLHTRNSTTVTRKKKTSLLHTGNSIADTDIEKKQLLRTGNSRTDTRVVVFLVHVLRKYAPLTLGLDNSSCESD